MRSRAIMAAGVSPISISLLFIGILAISPPCQGRLYNSTDDIVLLDNSTIVDVLYNSPVAWIVEFYSSWCGHCQTFAPTWKKLAQVVKDWQSVIRVAAIDCAEEINIGTCRDFAIEAYPTIKFFNASTKDRKNLGRYFKAGDKTFINLLHDIVRTVEQQTNLLHPAPKFNPITGEDIQDYQHGMTDFKYLVLVFEKSGSYVGRELALDMLRFPTIGVRRVLDTQKSLVDQYKITIFPSIVLMEKDYFRELSRQQRTHADFKRALHRLKQPMKSFPVIAEVEYAIERYVNLHEKTTPNTQHTARHTGSSTDVYLIDMVSGLSSMVWKEIPMKREITGDALLALRNFFKLVAECFPGKDSTTRFFLQMKEKLSNKLIKQITSDEFLSFAKTTNNIPKPRSFLSPSNVTWQACQGSDPSRGYRGYPCSLWTLFHTLTVQCGQRDIGTGTQTLLYIREYIRHFFTCSYCVKHFTAMAKNVEETVKSHDDAILWLWKGHNKANKRLHGDPSEDPKHPKIQFPSKDVCSNCQDKDGEWKEAMVLQFLKGHYGVDNIRIKEHVKAPPELDDADLVRKSRIHTDKSRIHTPHPHILSTMLTLGLNTYDTSLCLVVYTAIGVFLIAGYLYFMRRARRKRPYKYHIHTP